MREKAFEGPKTDFESPQKAPKVKEKFHQNRKLSPKLSPGILKSLEQTKRYSSITGNISLPLLLMKEMKDFIPIQVNKNKNNNYLYKKRSEQNSFISFTKGPPAAAERQGRQGIGAGVYFSPV